MTMFPPNQDRPVTLQDIKDKVAEYLVIKDECVIEVNIATFLANRLPSVHTPVWLLNVAESSGGKTEIIELFTLLCDDKYKLAYYLSDLTPQTFISGMLNSQKETSLLHKINGRILLMKDFTTILQKNQEARKEILSQFREIYDGGFFKDFGTGKSVKWKGRIGIIAGLTPPAFEMMGQFAGMGERFIAYYIDQPSDAELADRLKKNFHIDVPQKKREAQLLTAEYVNSLILLSEETDLGKQPLPDEIIDEINEVARFATRARSFVPLDFRTGEPIGLPSIERFARFSIQLQHIARGFILMNGRAELTQLQRRALYKIALDSVPRTRRAVLKILAGNRTVGTSAAAARLGFLTPIMRGYLSQLASLTLSVRLTRKDTGQNEDTWSLNSYAKKFMEKFEGIHMADADLLDEDDVEIMDTSLVTAEELARNKEDAHEARRHAEIAKVQRENPKLSWSDAEKAYDEMQAEIERIEALGDNF